MIKSRKAMKKLIIYILLISQLQALQCPSLLSSGNAKKIEYYVKLYKAEEVVQMEVGRDFKERFYWHYQRNKLNRFQTPSRNNMIGDRPFEFSEINDFTFTEYPEIEQSLVLTNLMIVHAQRYYDMRGISGIIQKLIDVSIWDYVYQKIDGEDYNYFTYPNGIIYLLDVFDALSYNYQTKYSRGTTRYIITGMYYDQCHYCEFRSLIMRFLMAKQNGEVDRLELHLPAEFIFKPKKKIGFALEAGVLTNVDLFEQYTGTLITVNRITGVTCKLLLNGVEYIKYGDGHTSLKLFLWGKKKSEAMLDYLEIREQAEIQQAK